VAFVVDKHGFRSVRPSSGASSRIGSGGPTSSSRSARGGERIAGHQSARELQEARPSISTKPLGSIPLVDESTVAKRFSEPERFPAGGGQPAVAAPLSNLAFSVRADVRQALALHSVLHKFWDKYRVVLFDSWLKLSQKLNLQPEFTRRVAARAMRAQRCYCRAAEPLAPQRTTESNMTNPE
jgi:hypothetical protein